jgi:GNAT superfamily N-acetyltransferase
MKSNSVSISIRLAAADDAPGIASVLSESFAEYKSFYTGEAFAATTPTTAQVLERMGQGPTWVALGDGGIVGTVSAVVREGGLYVRGMAILPAARGQKVGELLLKRIEDFARAHGLRRLFLSTTPFLTRAIRLYHSYGFRRSVEGPYDLCGTPLFTMEKQLDP